MIRENIKARHDAFIEGLTSVGFAVSCGAPNKARPGDVLLIWNRRGDQERLADDFEKAGGTVLVAEEGYIRRDRFYALARRYHNGGGEALVDDSARVSMLDVQLAEWRTGDGHILVCPNRFIGPSRELMPHDWTARTVATLRKLLPGREIRVRPHPGRQKNVLINGRSLADDLAGTALCVVWWSTAGVAALLAGIPTIYCARWWIASAAAGNDLRQAANPPRGDRTAVLQRIANSQFTPAEIASGTPFMSLVCH